MTKKKKYYPFLKRGDLYMVAAKLNVSYDRVRHVRIGSPKYDDPAIKMTLEKLNEKRERQATLLTERIISKIK